ncbi:ferritin-like domain-containing protein [Shewanella woodyi]|uniref:ferritin-like domain-containing protein n=1 Tax=Shewanella woodyi TaxID=60961 RepID=UPI0007F9791C|nr:ferritin-like domain-containing protein [Shewanella woodyi]
MKQEHLDWATAHFNTHLQGAVDLELWTIPYYMSAMYSIKDRSSDAYQLIRTVINQEMLHLQSAANIANAYGLSPKITPPTYEKNKIPHLNMSFNPSSITEPYMNHSFDIGPLDVERVNGMCLVELPDYGVTDEELILETIIDQYSSIGAFYRALSFGAKALKSDIKGGVRQVDAFSAFYRNMPNMTITESGELGINQVDLLIELITDQGEGQCKDGIEVPAVFQNTADDIEPEIDHFEKFRQIKDSGKLPETYSVKDPCDYTEEDKKLEQILIQQFGELTKLLQALFNGDNPQNFFPVMAGVGAAITNCWKHGVTPKYSKTNQL